MFARLRLAIALTLTALCSVAQDATASLTGVVRDVTGQSIPKAFAELRSTKTPGRLWRTSTDESGTYLFSGLTADVYTLKLESPGFASITVNKIRLGDDERKNIPPIELAVIDLTCTGHLVLDYLRLVPSEKAAGDIRARVRMDRGPRREYGPPVTGARVTLICGEAVTCAATKTDFSGEFLFTSISPGSYSMRVELDGFYPLRLEGYRVQSGFEAVYWPAGIERCPHRDCDPRRRHKRPLPRCE